MADITTLAAVKRQLAGPTGTMADTDDDLITTYVSQASQYIQTQCNNRYFTETPGTLTYDARYPDIEGRTLYFDQDVLAVDYVVNGSNGTITDDQFRLLPLNFSPKYGLELLKSSQLNWTTDSNGYVESAITVVGTLGYCTDANRPSDVTLAATKLAAFLYQTRDDDEGIIRTVTGDLILPAKASELVEKVIEKYRRRETHS